MGLERRKKRGTKPRWGGGGIPGWENLEQNAKVRALKNIICQLLNQIRVKEIGQLG